MKKFIIISVLLFLVSIYSMKGQRKTYSMLDGNPEWIYYAYNTRLGTICDGLTFFRYYLGDSVYIGYDDGKEYKGLWCEILDEKGEHVKMWLKDSQFVYSTNPFLLSLIEESDGKVYTASHWLQYQLCDRNGESDKDYMLLLYDFNYQKGDTLFSRLWLPTKGGLSEDIRQNKVIDRSPITLADGSVRSLLKIDCNNKDNSYWSKIPGYYYVELIEGIGAINSYYQLINYLDWLDYFLPNSFNYSKEFYNTTRYAHLNMFVQNGKVIYIAPRNDPNAQVDENHTTFKAMPFYPDITPESVASGKYSFNTSVQISKNDNSQEDYYSKYNIAGQRINTLQKGINIINGNKIMVK